MPDSKSRPWPERNGNKLTLKMAAREVSCNDAPNVIVINEPCPSKLAPTETSGTSMAADLPARL